MWSIGSKPKTNADCGAVSATSVTGPVGVALLIAVLLIYLSGIHPVRWFAAASIGFGLISFAVLRLRNLSATMMECNRSPKPQMTNSTLLSRSC